MGPWFGEYQPRSLETLVFFTKRGGILSREGGENKVSSGLLKKTHLQTFEGEFVERSLRYQTQMEGSNSIGSWIYPPFWARHKKRTGTRLRILTSNPHLWYLKSEMFVDWRWVLCSLWHTSCLTKVIALTWLTLSNGLHVVDIIGPHEIKILTVDFVISYALRLLNIVFMITLKLLYLCFVS